uniref:Uncharacterized protein n=1 Tax=Panagrolaimus sp. ES5 TaxID=591445 RepID=A0AC34G530_9BILA
MDLDDGEKNKNKKSAMISKDKATKVDIFIPPWVVELPNICAGLWVPFFIIFPLLWRHYNGIERPVLTNPCDENDSDAYQKFAASWKEKNHTKIMFKIIVEENNDMPNAIKENYIQDIQTATQKIWSQTIMDDSDYRRYEKCFSDNNQSKLNFITYICVINYVIFYICLISCCYFAELYSRRKLDANTNVVKNFPDNSFKLKDTACKLCLAIYPPIYLLLNILLYRMLSEHTVSTEFML